MFAMALAWAVVSAPVHFSDTQNTDKRRAEIETMRKHLQRQIDQISMDDPELRKSQIESLQRRMAELGEVEEVEEFGSEIHVTRYVDIDHLVSGQSKTSNELAGKRSHTLRVGQKMVVAIIEPNYWDSGENPKLTLTQCSPKVRSRASRLTTIHFLK
jgi:hypothetical protein